LNPAARLQRITAPIEQAVGAELESFLDHVERHVPGDELLILGELGRLQPDRPVRGAPHVDAPRLAQLPLPVQRRVEEELGAALAHWRDCHLPPGLFAKVLAAVATWGGPAPDSRSST
jgi:hypothetical protein